MATEVRLPQWSMGQSEGQIVEWYRSVGDRVEEDEPLAAVEAEKTEQDLEAPVSGTLLRILVTPETGVVPVRTVLAIIGEPDELVEDDVSAPATQTASVTQPVDGLPALAPVVIEPEHRQITPVARKLAKELGVELSSVSGTGPGGRVMEDDVRRAATSSSSGSDAARSVALSGMRAAIAKRMLSSIQTMAQLTLSRQVDVTALVEAQRSLKQTAGISITDLVLRGVALALLDHPRLNATLENDLITEHSHVQLGIAVALDDGLIVPVIRDADTKSLRQLSEEARDLATRARAGTALPAEVSGSTFTVTNLGASDIAVFTPIINPPEVAILGVGRITDVFTRDDAGGAWRSMLTLSLTIDHRAVDGAPGARFLMSLADVLSDMDALADGT